MKLFHAPGACSLATHIVLEEAGAHYQAVRVNMREGEHKKPEYLKLNPKGKVPALELDNGQVLTENPAIQNYVADMHPQAGLLAPVGQLERYRALEHLAWCASWVQATALGPLFAPTATPQQRETAQQALNTFAQRLNGKFVLGDQFSIADSYTLVFYGWAMHFKLEIPSLLKQSAQKVYARPAVQRAVAAEGLQFSF